MLVNKLIAGDKKVMPVSSIQLVLRRTQVLGQLICEVPPSRAINFFSFLNFVSTNFYLHPNLICYHDGEFQEQFTILLCYGSIELGNCLQDIYCYSLCTITETLEMCRKFFFPLLPILAMPAPNRPLLIVVLVLYLCFNNLVTELYFLLPKNELSVK